MLWTGRASSGVAPVEEAGLQRSQPVRVEMEWFVAMKTITMMELRSHPGEYAFRVRADGESFLVTYMGKPCFKMVPCELSSEAYRLLTAPEPDVDIVILPDGTVRGPRPLTMGLDLGDYY
jgi:antitoxin (DNA-binding transcriptional repressor) of toxin-antitoxin stability system